MLMPRRLREATKPKPPMYVIETNLHVTAEFARELRQKWRIAAMSRVPLPLVLGPGLTVKEIKR